MKDLEIKIFKFLVRRVNGRFIAGNPLGLKEICNKISRQQKEVKEFLNSCGYVTSLLCKKRRIKLYGLTAEGVYEITRKPTDKEIFQFMRDDFSSWFSVKDIVKITGLSASTVRRKVKDESMFESCKNGNTIIYRLKLDDLYNRIASEPVSPTIPVQLMGMVRRLDERVSELNKKLASIELL